MQLVPDYPKLDFMLGLIILPVNEIDLVLVEYQEEDIIFNHIFTGTCGECMEKIDCSLYRLVNIQHTSEYIRLMIKYDK